MPKIAIPKRYQKAVSQLKKLEQDARYLGAFIFGSVARGQTSLTSDMDVNVIVDTNDSCPNVSHPIIDGVKLDISFPTLKHFQKRAAEQADKRDRIPWIAESIIVFDKTGELKKLKKQLQKIKPQKTKRLEHKWIQFLVYQADEKAQRNLEDDPYTALLAMDININDILKFHYQINGRWWVSNKRLLKELRVWDPDLAQLLEQFVMTVDVHQKYDFWSKIIAHVLQPLGGQLPITENNCNCRNCKKDLKVLSSSINAAAINEWLNRV